MFTIRNELDIRRKNLPMGMNCLVEKTFNQRSSSPTSSSKSCSGKCERTTLFNIIFRSWRPQPAGLALTFPSKIDKRSLILF